jgi:pilus assembly protein CpaF
MEGFYRKTGNGAADPPAAVRTVPSALSFRAAERNQAQEQEWKHRIHARLLEVVDLSLITGIEEKHAKSEIREVANRLMNEESAPLNAPSRQRVIKQIEDEILALGPLEPLLADPAVTDILVNGCEAVYVERGGKLERVAVHFKDDAHVPRHDRSHRL